MTVFASWAAAADATAAARIKAATGFLNMFASWIPETRILIQEKTRER
jgi:hypothetical protein